MKIKNSISGFVASIVLCISGCDGGDPADYIKATIELPDGSVVEFNEPCICILLGESPAGDGHWSFYSSNLDSNLGLSVIWWEGQDIVLPWSCELLGEGASACQVSVTIVTSIDPYEAKYYYSFEGVMTFDRLGYEEGDKISGTFESVVLERDFHDPLDESLVVVNKGRFLGTFPQDAP